MTEIGSNESSIARSLIFFIKSGMRVTRLLSIPSAALLGKAVPYSTVRRFTLIRTFNGVCAILGKAFLPTFVRDRLGLRRVLSASRFLLSLIKSLRTCLHSKTTAALRTLPRVAAGVREGTLRVGQHAATSTRKRRCGNETSGAAKYMPCSQAQAKANAFNPR